MIASLRRAYCEHRGQRREDGFALLIVLWTLVLVALIIGGLVVAGRQETQLAANLRAAAVLDAAADGVVYLAIFHALDVTAGHWAADGRPHAVSIPGGRAVVRIRSEAGKINPNVARPRLLAALLRAVGVDPPAAQRLAAAIVAWRSPAGEAPPMAAAYRAARLGYRSPHAPFETIQELSQVVGMTPSILARLRPHLTLYHPGDPDPDVADQAVRQALTQVYGKLPVGNRTGPDNSVIEIVVHATTSSGSADTQRVLVQVGTQSHTTPFAILRWR